MAAKTLFSRFLEQLGVPHTTTYSDAQFEGMTFKSLFGLSHLLSSYGIKNDAWRLDDKQEIVDATPPFLAQMNDGVFSIVKRLDTGTKSVTYDSMGKTMVEPLESFMDFFNGVILTAYPTAESTEPDLRTHRLTEIVTRSTRWVLLVSLLVVISYFFVSRGFWHHPALWFTVAFDCLGIYFSFLLMQKNLGIKTTAGDRVCGVLQKGGCDDIMSMKVSKLFGVISWSEVGLGYFSVSLVTLLLFPHLWGALALFNICCLPYTFWSISYQKFVAKKWCTLCVGVQTTLWLLFFSYLCGGMMRHILPLQWDYAVLLATYVGAVMALNLFASVFRPLINNRN